ncbi:unnamed protein product [Parnassius mnemosyne]|uniref:Uncharacterized protein n=1 Tax=Parnassius mnemosyne TaxID=213953 RepID=A0AAV1LFG6_9NEOP
MEDNDITSDSTKSSNAANTSQAIDLSLPATSSKHCATDTISHHPETNQLVNEDPHNYSDISTDSDSNYKPSSSESSSSDTETVSRVDDEDTVCIQNPFITSHDSEWVDITSSMPNIEEQQVLDDKLPRKQRKYCHICPKRLKRKTSFLCHNCMKPVCLACTKKICTHCVATAKD